MTAEMTYSLAEATAIIRGKADKSDMEWVSRRLCSGVFQGYKPGRSWRMTPEQLAANITALAPKRERVPDVPLPAGLTATSRRRLARSA